MKIFNLRSLGTVGMIIIYTGFQQHAQALECDCMLAGRFLGLIALDLGLSLQVLG